MSAEKLIVDLESFTKSYQEKPDQLDQSTRIRLQQAAVKAFHSLEDGYDLSRRITVESPAEQTSIRLGCDLKIFETLGAAKAPMTVEELNKKIQIEPSVLARIVQALTGFGSLRQTPEGYVLSPSASNFAEPDFAQCFGVCQDWLLPIYQALPKKLAKEEYKLPQTDATNVAVQHAWEEQGKNLFQILGERPAVGKGFSQLMTTWGLHGSLLYHYYPVEDRLVKGFDPSISDVMFVDVGGNWGQKAIAIKEKFPNIPGRFVVQDQPMYIESAPKTDMVEFTVHDFFTTQPIKNPRAFYIRQTLHNWSDEAVLKILTSLVPAMKPGYTRLLLHEQLIQEHNPTAWVVTQDINMMTQLATKERTESNWRQLIKEAGLMVTKIYYAEDGVSESVIEVEKK